jgi:hypothetical protein
MSRLHLLDKPEGATATCIKCKMLLIFSYNDRKFTTDEQVWLASKNNCDKVQPEYKLLSPLIYDHH